MMKYAILLLALVATSSALPSSERVRRSYAAYPVPAAVPVVPALAAVPTLTAVHSQRLVPQPPAVHTVATPTTVLQTVQTGHAVVGHQHVGDQVVGKTPDVNGYAFRSDVRHDAPVAPVVAAPVYAAPLVGPATLPVPVVAAPAPVYAAAPAPVYAAPAPVYAAPAPAPVYAPAPAAVKSYSVETGHTIAHDHIVTSPVIQQTLHAPVIGAAPVVAPVAYPAPAPLALPAYKKA